MSENSAIEWTDATWNPVLGCSKVSEGCRGCYAILQAWMKQSNRHEKVREAYAGLVEKRPDGSLNWTGRVNTLPERLAIPLGWARPKRIFVNSLSDLFHPDVPDAFIDSVFAVMAWAQQHTFQVLTKRPERMAAYLSAPDVEDRITSAMCDVCSARPTAPCGFPGDDCGLIGAALPLDNVWLGTSVEDQDAADQRIPHLLATPAAVRFLSCEPLLGPVDLTARYMVGCPSCGLAHLGYCELPTAGISWVITGGESGPKARPIDPAWARSLRDQCVAAGVPFFFKQWSGRTSKAAGRLLDGRTWDEFPRVAALAGAGASA